MTQQVLVSEVLNEHALDAALIVRSEICYFNSCNCNSGRAELVQLVSCYVMQECSGFHPAALFCLQFARSSARVGAVKRHSLVLR